MAVLWTLTALLGGSSLAMVMAVVGPLAMLLPFLPEIHGTWLHYRGTSTRARPPWPPSTWRTSAPSHGRSNA
jgi:hypothetical protein